MSFEQVGDLVRLEKDDERKLENAHKEAAEMVKKAQQEAEKLLKGAEEQNYDGFFKDRKLQFEKEKKEINESADERVKILTQLANKNKKKAIPYIAEKVLGE